MIRQGLTFIRAGTDERRPIIKIGLVGPSYQMRSLPFDAQRTVNLYPISDESGKEVSSLFGTPGLTLFSTLTASAGRKCYSSANGRAFVVSGARLFELTSAGVATDRGGINQSSGNISIAENGLEMAICDGQNLYIFTYATDVLAQVTAPGLPTNVGVVVSIDGYFIVNEVNTGRFYISGLLDGNSWDALDFATAESTPDNLLSMANSNGQLFLLGSRSFEIWTNTGNSAFPFQRISGAVGDAGILAPYSTVDVDNSLIWVGQDRNGKGMVYRTQGFRPQRISTEAIEIILQSIDDPEDMRGYCYQQDGHVFYVITGGGLNTSLCYDLTTQLWHERAYLAPDGSWQQHLAADCMFAFDKHIVCDRRNGLVYEMALDVYSDNGEPLARERTYTHLIDEAKEIRYNRLEIGFEVGVGLQSGQGSNPQVSLQLSKDGARTWSNWHNQSIGRVGKYLSKVVFRRLGVADQMTFRIRISDPVKISITGSYLS